MLQRCQGNYEKLAGQGRIGIHISYSCNKFVVDKTDFILWTLPATSRSVSLYICRSLLTLRPALSSCFAACLPSIDSCSQHRDHWHKQEDDAQGQTWQTQDLGEALLQLWEVCTASSTLEDYPCKAEMQCTPCCFEATLWAAFSCATVSSGSSMSPAGSSSASASASDPAAVSFCVPDLDRRCLPKVAPASADCGLPCFSGCGDVCSSLLAEPPFSFEPPAPIIYTRVVWKSRSGVSDQSQESIDIHLKWSTFCCYQCAPVSRIHGVSATWFGLKRHCLWIPSTPAPQVAWTYPQYPHIP